MTKIRYLLFMALATVLFYGVDNVKAIESNQGITGGGGGGAGASANTELAGCGSWMNGFSYSKDSGGQMAIRATMEWREGDTIKILGNPIYIYRSGTDLGGGSNKIQNDSWFDEYTVNYERIYSDLVGGGKQANINNLNRYLRAMGLKGNTDSTLVSYASKSCRLNAKNGWNCAGKAGLRFIVENVIFTKNCGSNYYAARELPNTGYFAVFPWDKMLNGASSDTNITHDGGCNGSNTRDPYHSCGLNYYDVIDSIPVYNYYIDSACTNCEWNGKQGAYNIQDITNWNAILASKDATSNTIKTYYKTPTGCGDLYCREEYNVTFPNKNDGLQEEILFNVGTGRYFTVNNVSKVGNGIYNFGPIEVTKTKQCITENNNTSCLNNYASQSDSLGDFGTIKLSYKENKGGKYNTTDLKLIPDTSDARKLNKTVTSSVVKVNDSNKNIITIKGTISYVLPENTYRYFEKGSGTATTTKKSRVDYDDMGTTTLPVSFENSIGKKENSSNAGGTISLSYSLPENSKISKAFSNPSYFQNQKNTKNIYKKYQDNEVKDDESKADLANSSCAKIYDSTSSSEFKTCAANNVSDTTKNCRDAIKDYTCKFNVCKEGEVVGADGECTEPGGGDGGGGDCSNGKCECRVEGGKYYDENGREISEAVFKENCTCKVLGLGKYLGSFENNGKLITDYYEYAKQCYQGENCPIEQQLECAYTINGNKCLRCPYTGACPMPGGVCPYPGGSDIIYRPIDLINPFPAQSGAGRQTGDNWCYYNLQNNTLDCGGGNGSDTTNKVVQKQIKQNRGASSYSVYGKKPLYKVVLNPQTLKSLKNKNYNYDDWSTIKCHNQTGCTSDFLRKELKGLVSGTCISGNAKTCANEGEDN